MARMVAQDLRVFPRLGRLFASLQVRSMLIMMWASNNGLKI